MKGVETMAPIAQEIASMVDMLPEQEQALAFEMIKRMVLAWDPDFTKVTDMERAQIDQAAAEKYKAYIKRLYLKYPVRRMVPVREEAEK